jgi:hypothetical protein
MDLETGCLFLLSRGSLVRVQHGPLKPILCGEPSSHASSALSSKKIQPIEPKQIENA